MNVQLEGITRYADASEGREPILRGIGCTIRSGEVTLLAGHTGSGKSTLLHVLAGLKPPHEGQIRYGEDALWRNGKPDKKLLMGIGLVFQYPEQQLFAATVESEIRYSLKPFRLTEKERDARIRETARVLGLSEELLGRSPFTLSGGEKRKTAIASVIAAKPRWLLLDEPSCGLDGEDAESLARWLASYKASSGNGGGIVIATHDLDLFLPIADRVLLLRNGSVFGEYTPAELVRSPDVLAEAGIGMPTCVKLAAFSQGSGGSFRVGTEWEPEAWAESIYASLSADNGNGAAVTRHMPAPAITRDAAPAAINNAESRFERLDPRSKWLIYVLFSIGMFYRPGWGTVLSGTAFLVIAGVLSGVPVRRWTKPLLPFTGFILISAAVSGLQLRLTLHPFSLAGTSFSLEASLGTVRRLLPLLPVMAGGLLFARTTSTMMMKRGLEAPLRLLPVVRHAAETVSMAASLMFRFLHIIGADIERFACIASSRGKKGNRPGILGLRQLPAFLTPLLLSILHHAEDLSVAMEARGYKLKGEPRTSAIPIRMHKRDYAAIFLGVIVFLMLLASGCSG